MRKPTFWFPTWSDINQAVQLQKMARGLKFRIWKVEELSYPCSDNKGADQLHGYCNADLRLFFFHMQNIGFLMTRFIFDWRLSSVVMLTAILLNFQLLSNFCTLCKQTGFTTE